MDVSRASRPPLRGLASVARREAPFGSRAASLRSVAFLFSDGSLLSAAPGVSTRSSQRWRLGRGRRLFELSGGGSVVEGPTVHETRLPCTYASCKYLQLEGAALVPAG